MSVTQPSSPSRTFPLGRSLRTRWRTYMLLGMGLLIVVIISSAALIVVLGQRQSMLNLHGSAAQQIRAAAQETLRRTQQMLAYAAQTGIAEEDLPGLLAAAPALRSVSLVDEDGTVIAHVPDGESANSPALEAETLRAPTAVLTADDPSVFVLTVPLAGGGALVAEADPQRLWENIVTPPVAGEGYAYLVSEQGAVLAVPPGVRRDPSRRPADFESVRAALSGAAGLHLYRGLMGDWVIGYAETLSDPNLIVITETPLTIFSPVLVRQIALWVLALVLAVVIAEWLLRRLLRTVLKPLDALRQGAKAVELGDYRYRIRVPANADRELGDLGHAFNSMIGKLQASQAQIDAYTNEIEGIVDLRARELSRKALQLEVAAEVSGKIATLLDPRTLIREVVALLQARFNIYHVEILITDTEKNTVTSSSGQTLPAASLYDETTSVIGWVVRHGKTLYVPNVAQEIRYRPSADRPASQCELAIPLKFGGKVIGVLNLEADHRNAFQKDEIAVLESLANGIAVSLHNAQVFEALEIANRDLAQATLEAKQANLVKSRFLLNASHKLRTPLNAVIGYSETILSGIYGPVPEKVQDRQRRILENGRILQALIEDMLDLSAIEAGTMEMRLAWVDLVPLLQEVMNAAGALHQTGYANHRLTLRLDLDEPLPRAWADVNRLRYILINLMSNGVKFTEAGEVVMAATCTDESILIQVRDTGPGISEDELTHLFEPFQHQRGSTSSSGKGTGLGLPVSRLLAQMHGGDLLVESTLHQGSTFTLRLPRREGDMGDN